MVYAADSKSAARKGLGVQVSSPAQLGIIWESSENPPRILRESSENPPRFLRGSSEVPACEARVRGLILPAPGGGG